MALLLWGLQFRPINRQRLFKHSQLHLVSINRTRMRTQVSSTMNSWQNIKSDSRLAQLQTLACFALMGLVLHLVTYHHCLLITAPACGDAGHSSAMVMKMKRRSSLDINVAESEAKLDASACHSLVGGVATSALMKLIPAPISDANSKDCRKTVRQ